MVPSLSWIEKSALTQRLSELTRPVGYPVPDPVTGRPAPRSAAEMSPDTPTIRGVAPPRHRPPTVPPEPARVGLGPSSHPPTPAPVDQDPWTMTPAQPWTAVAVPHQDRPVAGIPELSYPPVMALAARLELFRDWIRQYCGEGAFFVSDPEGLPLLLDKMRTSQAVTAVALERALHPLRGLIGSSRANSLCIELEDGRLVQTVWTTTRAGRIAVGMAPPRPLGPVATAQVRRALLGLFAGEEAQ